MLNIFLIVGILSICPVSIQLYYLYKSAYRIRVSVDDSESTQTTVSMQFF